MTKQTLGTDYPALVKSGHISPSGGLNQIYCSTVAGPALDELMRISAQYLVLQRHIEGVRCKNGKFVQANAEEIGDI